MKPFAVFISIMSFLAVAIIFFGVLAYNEYKDSPKDTEQVFHIKVKNEKAFIVVTANDQEVVKIEKNKYEENKSLLPELNKVMESAFPYIWGEATFDLTVTCPSCDCDGKEEQQE